MSLPSFEFYDGRLLDLVKQGDPHVHQFFRLLALCHTIMPEEKNGIYVHRRLLRPINCQTYITLHYIGGAMEKYWGQIVVLGLWRAPTIGSEGFAQIMGVRFMFLIISISFYSVVRVKNYKQ